MIWKLQIGGGAERNWTFAVTDGRAKYAVSIRELAGSLYQWSVDPVRVVSTGETNGRLYWRALPSGVPQGPRVDFSTSQEAEDWVNKLLDGDIPFEPTLEGTVQGGSLEQVQTIVEGQIIEYARDHPQG